MYRLGNGRTLPDSIKKYIEASDNASDYADSLIEGLEPQALEDIDYLMNNVENRDVELWEDDEIGVDVELTVSDYEADEDRDIEWQLGLAGLAAVSSLQFFLDNRYDTIIKPVAYREQVMSPFSLSREQLTLAGARKAEIEAVQAYEKLSSKVLKELEPFTTFSNKELYGALRELDALPPFDDMVSKNMGYVSRMTDLPPGSPRFNEEVNALINSNSTRGMKSMNRRSIQQIYTARELAGDFTKLMAWITESGKNVCDYCAHRGGEVRTYTQWVEVGLPGASVCKGGDL